jgi:hypothetical protein
MSRRSKPSLRQIRPYAVWTLCNGLRRHGDYRRDPSRQAPGL